MGEEAPFQSCDTMKKKTAVLLLLFCFVPLSPCAGAYAPQDDDTTRGAFIETRPAPSAKGRHRTRPARRDRAKEAPVTDDSSVPVASSKAIGFGYTIYQANAAGEPVRVDPKKQFRTGERVRFLVEPGIDGYIYIFHRENDGRPELIYPDPRIAGGTNRTVAHALMEIPSRREPNPRARWFTFFDPPAVEHLYFVVARSPLAAIPTGADLLAYYEAHPDAGPWRPPSEVWDGIETGAKASAFESVLAKAGASQPRVEVDALTRGFGLPKTAPQPAVVRVSASSEDPFQVTVIDLVHESDRAGHPQPSPTKPENPR